MDEKKKFYQVRLLLIKSEAQAKELVRDLEISNFIHGSIKKTALDKFMSF